VLLAESDVGDAELVQIWLRRAQETRYEIWHVESLGDAAGCLAKASFDLALVDLSLPDAPGPWAFHALHERWPDLPIIVFSSFADAEIGARLLGEGALDHLVKGQMSGDVLIRSMRHALERGQLARELAAAREAAQDSGRLRAELVTELAQEIRTPLHTVLGMADLLRETELTREQEGYVRSFQRASEALLGRLDALLGHSEPAEEEPARAALPARPVSQESLRLLVADDAQETRERLAAQLREASHHVDVAGDGRAAVEMFREGDYDLVLLDVQMPELDGLEATRAIRRIEAEAGRDATPILAVTGLASPEDVRACLEAGCDGHLAKPVSRERLLAAVARHAPKRHGRLLRVDVASADQIDLYLHERHNDLAGLRFALEADDLESVRVLGQQLEGSALDQGFAELADLGRRLQDAAGAPDREAVERAVADLGDFLREVKIVIG
jgi:CheY-like chemotaxis protein